MGCVFCKKMEPASKEDVGPERDFRSQGTEERYYPDPTQGRSSSVCPQPTSPAFLNVGNVRSISGGTPGLVTAAVWVLGKTKEKGDSDLSLEASRMI